MNVDQAFREKVTYHLSRLTDDIKPVLKALIDHDYPKDVVSLAFEVFVDGFTEEFPVRVFFMDAENSEHFVYVDGKAEYPSPVDPGLLNIDHVYPPELEEEYTNKSDTLDPWWIATEALIEWFSKCWLAAGGGTFKLKATIAPHDSNNAFNLVENRWQACD